MDKGGPTPVANRPDGFGHVIHLCQDGKTVVGLGQGLLEPAGPRLELVISGDELTRPNDN